MQLPFVKMHGLGNDFVVLDARDTHIALPERARRLIADRRRGVGCDQLIVLEPVRDGSGADVFMRIYNPDGSEAGACGNATRCIAHRIMGELERPVCTIETVAGMLRCSRAAADGPVTVDMGPARLEWHEIPLARAVDTLHLPVTRPGLAEPVAVGMGNPHVVFFVDDADQVAVGAAGPDLEHDPMFPERANIEFVSLTAPDRLRLRVWERGAGITQACGSGACAAAVAAIRRGLTGRQVAIDLDGGTLDILWREDGHVLMSGPIAESFSGHLNPTLLAG